tara:strand:+ start:357 stop:572 length:216 start_codon:yes stop_codon:yes gene_type:complete
MSLCRTCGTQYYTKAGSVVKCPDEKCDADVGFEAAVRIVAESGAACAVMQEAFEQARYVSDHPAYDSIKHR